MTYLELYREGCRELTEQGIENAEYDARELLLWAFSLDLNTYLLKRGEEAEALDRIEAFRGAIKRRKAHEPLQYITNRADFYGRAFLVEPGVLIPRYDTETLIEACLPYLREGSRILDVCTGSGCILLTLLLEGQTGIEGIGVDISDTAIAVARENAARLGVQSAELLKSDLFEAVEGQFDLIVSNPPYIRSDVIPTLSEEVREFEPHLALDGTEDGLAFYRRITEEAPQYLKAGACLAFEIGYDQGEAVAQLMQDHGFTEVRCLRDLGQLDRVVMGKYI